MGVWIKIESFHWTPINLILNPLFFFSVYTGSDLSSGGLLKRIFPRGTLC